MNMLTNQELIGLTLLSKRQAHATMNNLTTEESQKALPASKLWDTMLDSLPNEFKSTNGNGIDPR